MNRHDVIAASIVTSTATGFGALLPEVLGYAGKVFGVFVFAVVAELARRLVSGLLERKKS